MDKRILAIVFDIDGTLLDTSEFIFEAFEHTLFASQLPLVPRKKLSKLMGISLAECYKKLTLEDKNIEKLCIIHRNFQSENLRLAKPFEHTKDTLRKLKDLGIKMAITTIRSKENSIPTLKLAGIHSFFEIIVSFEDSIQHKPFPDAILKALKRIRINPINAIVVGNMPEDIQAGKAAGTLTIGALYGFKGRNLMDSKPDFCISNIQEILSIIS